MMVRSFLPVGQGAFYSECFDTDYLGRKLNVIYDCGAFPGVHNVKREIENQFEKGEIIDAVFISHLDADHINGLPHLLKYCKVKKIYFPLISSRNKVLLKIGLDIRGAEGFVVDFLEEPRRTISELGIDYEVELIGVMGRETDGEIFDRERDYPIVLSGSDVFEDIKAGLHSGSIIGLKWRYIPFNFEQKSRKEQLMNALEKKFGRSISENDVEKIWRYGSSIERKDIKEAYKCVQDDLNTNSMIVYSGPSDTSIRQMIMPGGIGCGIGCGIFCDCWRDNFRAGCLYTGDYDASDSYKCNMLKRAYAKYWEDIGCIQIPHHGSKHNFSEEILKDDAFCIISAGFSNKFGHPASSVIKKILLNYTMPFVVTEKVNSAVYIRVN